MRKKTKRLSPYKRLENELGYARAALCDAAAQYVRAIQALADLLAIYDRPPGTPWEVAEVERIAKIRQIAEGK
jgi:hypothetical protein